MTKETLAATLNGRQIGDEITSLEESKAKASRLVVLFGGSDDLAEFRGAIHDEATAWAGAHLFVHVNGILPEHDRCECDYCGYDKAKADSVAIEALWQRGAYSWVYITNIPHATFEVFEGEEKYCRGIVFSLDALVV
jgi:hypothetical protein